MTYRSLFLDDRHIADMPGLTRRVHEGTRHPDPLLRADNPWEDARVQIGGNSVLYDPDAKRFRMYYLAYPKQPIPYPSDAKFIENHWGSAAYAESDDGFHWRKPELGQVRWLNTHDRTNLLHVFTAYSERAGVLFDAHESDPDRRFKMMAWTQKLWAYPPGRQAYEEGEHHVYDEQNRLIFRHPYNKVDTQWGVKVAFSADGIHWRQATEKPVLSCYSDTGHSILFDPHLKRYVAFGRFNMGNTFTATDVTFSNRTGREYNIGRSIGRIESEDCLHWSQPELVLTGDHLDPLSTQFDTMAVSLYEGLYVGFLECDRRPFPHPHGGTPLQLTCSRDGFEWTRVGQRAGILKAGASGAWDDAGVRVGSGPILVGDRVFFFYSGVGRAEGHKALVPGAATWRRDGFVSLRGGPDGGELLTRPFILRGPELHLNVDARAGEVAVQVCDAQGHPFQGWSKRFPDLADNTINPGINPNDRPDAAWGVSEWSRPIRGDHLDAKIDWANNDLAHRVGKPISLRVRLRDADVYSFWAT